MPSAPHVTPHNGAIIGALYVEEAVVAPGLHFAAPCDRHHMEPLAQTPHLNQMITILHSIRLNADLAVDAESSVGKN